jgi:hypothetical protein
MAAGAFESRRKVPASSDSGSTLMRRLDDSAPRACANATTIGPVEAPDYPKAPMPDRRCKRLESASAAEVNAANKGTA